LWFIWIRKTAGKYDLPAVWHTVEEWRDRFAAITVCLRKDVHDGNYIRAEYIV